MTTENIDWIKIGLVNNANEDNQLLISIYDKIYNVYIGKDSENQELWAIIFLIAKKLYYQKRSFKLETLLIKWDSYLVSDRARRMAIECSGLSNLGFHAEILHDFINGYEIEWYKDILNCKVAKLADAPSGLDGGE